MSNPEQSTDTEGSETRKESKKVSISEVQETLALYTATEDNLQDEFGDIQEHYEGDVLQSITIGICAMNKKVG